MEGVPTTAAEAEGAQTSPRSGELADALSDSLAVQMDEAAASSASRHPVQMVTSEETGAYKGYTLGGSKPTFYFEKVTSPSSTTTRTMWAGIPTMTGTSSRTSPTRPLRPTRATGRRGIVLQRPSSDWMSKRADDARPGEGSMVEGDVMTGAMARRRRTTPREVASSTPRMTMRHTRSKMPTARRLRLPWRITRGRPRDGGL